MAMAIKIVTPANSGRAINTITRAFSSDPAARWLYPDGRQYVKSFPSFINVFAGAAFAHASAHCVDDYSGTALWLPPGIHPDEKALEALLRESISERDQEAVFELFEKMEKYHPAEPHWYLPMIGVDPAKQGTGYGSALLKHALERCDADDKLAYLESSSPKNLPFYERFGFERLGTIAAGSSPPLFPMLRKSRPVAARKRSGFAALENYPAERT